MADRSSNVLPADTQAEVQGNETEDCSLGPTSKELRLSIVAFVAALLFTAIGFASEAAGAHWYVGCLCVTGVSLCVFMILRLHGLERTHFQTK
ncbi:MAG: hypothetical protein HKN47_04010 [Pirellulaceae bacterium]|nr:hypothetical protein [Pirellulaceae bacterium]